MTPEEYCQDKAAKSGSSFYYSFLFLPDRQRKAITALYAFCREVDDVVDECQEPDIAQRKLDWWRTEINAAFDGKPNHPVTRAIGLSTPDFNLPREYFLEIIDGMEMDLFQTRYASFNDLSLYCYRVASVVGLMAAEIFGYQDRATLKYAHNLGMAFQLTNIVRDIKEDAQRGRIYIPLEDLASHNIEEQEFLALNNSPAMIQLINTQVTRANEFYTKAFELLPAEDRYAQRTGLIMSVIYQKILSIIEQSPEQVLQQRVSISPIHKLWLAWKTARSEKRQHRARHATN